MALREMSRSSSGTVRGSREAVRRSLSVAGDSWRILELV